VIYIIDRDSDLEVIGYNSSYNNKIKFA